MLVDEEHVLLETRVQVWFKAKLVDDGVMVAVDMGVDTVHALEDLAHQRWERLGERHAYCSISVSLCDAGLAALRFGWCLTDPTREDSLVVDAALNPRHQLFNVRRCRHLRRPLVVFGVLPQVFKPDTLACSPSAVMLGSVLVRGLHLGA